MRFRLRRQKLMRPTLTPEQARLLEMVDQAGSPKAAAQGLFGRLAELESQVEQWQSRSDEETPPSREPEPAPDPTP